MIMMMMVKISVKTSQFQFWETSCLIFSFYTIFKKISISELKWWWRHYKARISILDLDFRFVCWFCRGNVQTHKLWIEMIGQLKRKFSLRLIFNKVFSIVIFIFNFYHFLLVAQWLILFRKFLNIPAYKVYNDNEFKFALL